MKDSIILGSGNSRYLKSVEDFKRLYPTYDDFAAALVAGTLPIDFNGINSSGFQQLGDALCKSNLLKDTTAALFGLGADSVPDDVLAKIGSNFPRIETGSYVGSGASERTGTISTSIENPELIIITGHRNDDHYKTKHQKVFAALGKDLGILFYSYGYGWTDFDFEIFALAVTIASGKVAWEAKTPRIFAHTASNPSSSTSTGVEADDKAPYWGLDASTFTYNYSIFGL